MNLNNDLSPDEDKGDHRLTLIEHLDELRSRIIKCLVAVSIGTLVSFIFSEQLLNFLIKPCLPVIKVTYFTSILQPFNVRLKAAVFGGLVFTGPVVIYQIWKFIKPALKVKERRIITGIFGFAVLLFLIGIALAYYLIIPMGTEVLISYKTSTMLPLIGIEEVLNFVVVFMIGMGIVFELPMVMLGLAKVGIVNHKMLASNRKYAIVGTLIASTAITPGSEVLTSLILWIPLYLLYELSIFIIRFVEPKESIFNWDE